MEARLDTRYHHVARLTKAVVFLSTPHRGSDLVVYLRRLLSISAPSNTKQYVAELEENGFLLRELNDQFRHVAPSLQIFSFFEALKTSRAGFSAVHQAHNLRQDISLTILRSLSTAILQSLGILERSVAPSTQTIRA